MKKKIGAMPVFVVVMLLLIGLAIWQAALPDKLFSDIENRPLQRLDAPSVSTVASGKWMREAEAYAADQFPARDVWMALQALWDAARQKAERNGILLGREGWMFENSARLDLRTARHNVEALNALAAWTDAPVTLVLAPMSSAISPLKLPQWAEADDQEAILRSLYGATNGLQTLDILSMLRETQTSAYFRTDHHWTDAGAAAAYEALAAAWGLTPVDWPMEILEAGVTYGSYYARAPSPLIAGEPFVMAQPLGVALFVEGEPMDGLYDAQAMAHSRDKYAQLLYGNHGRMTLKSNADGGTLLVLKDSYANLLLPRLSQHFGRIEAIDLRYFAGDLQSVLEETEAKKILCLYGLTTFLTDRNLVLHAAGFGE